MLKTIESERWRNRKHVERANKERDDAFYAEQQHRHMVDQVLRDKEVGWRLCMVGIPMQQRHGRPSAVTPLQATYALYESSMMFGEDVLGKLMANVRFQSEASSIVEAARASCRQQVNAATSTASQAVSDRNVVIGQLERLKVGLHPGL